MNYTGNMLGISWHDSAWIPILKPNNVLDYFSERSNPFYDRTCNNEVIKMQRLNPEQMNNMTGIEYVLFYAQEPILYVVRKQHRHGPNQVAPLFHYYIIAGVVYQSPDIGSIINARMLSAAHHLHFVVHAVPSIEGLLVGIQRPGSNRKKNKTKIKVKEEMSSLFQRQRVDLLLNELTKRYPPKYPTPVAAIAPPPTPAPAPAATEKLNPDENTKPEIKTEIKQEKQEWISTPPPIAATNRNSCKPPPEKKMRTSTLDWPGVCWVNQILRFVHCS
uniref:Mediator of RNA polymerase II transcription subunit 6 n=1 Tax=Strigamia maritima TaxID=126957 RepID=T1JAN2_STRMM